MSREPCPDRSPELPEWRRSGPFFLIAATLHLAVLALPRTPAVAAMPRPLQVQLADVRPVEVQPPIPEPQPVSASSPTPAKQVEHPLRRRPILAMSPERQPPTPDTPLVAAPPENVTEAAPAAPPAAAVAAAPSAEPVVIAARYNAAYLNNPKPKYPPLSRRLGEEGKVLLRVRVTADGRPGAVDVEKTSNFSRLDEAACQAVAGWRFVPARRGGEAVESSVIVPIDFHLDG
ncbi:MAG: TonB family protein [Desulfobulbus sp.]|nr:TonB family protein [Desulfobulbus sp.]